jgi:hypothetical protein
VAHTFADQACPQETVTEGDGQTMDVKWERGRSRVAARVSMPEFAHLRHAPWRRQHNPHVPQVQPLVTNRSRRHGNALTRGAHTSAEVDEPKR